MYKKFIPLLTIIMTILSLTGCHKNANGLDRTKTIHNHQMAEVKSWISRQWPQSVSIRPTTSSSIYINNLNASIKSLQLLNQTHGKQHQWLLADKLYLRYTILGNFNDAKLALSTISEAISQSHPKANDHLIAAKILSGLHRFAESKKALIMASQMGANKQQVTQLEKEINFSLGNYQLSSSKDIIDKAKQELLKGNIKIASTYYREAELKYLGSDPYVLAWIQLQQGIVFLKYGEIESARYFFKTAHERFPEYYLVTEHLAETELLLGNLKTAESLYRKVSIQSNNPEYWNQLSITEALLGKTKASIESKQKAQKTFDELLKHYPLSINDHAVGFYIDQGQTAKALALAQMNIDNRQDIESWILLADTAYEANEIKMACDAYLNAKSFQFEPSSLYQLSNKLSPYCK